MSKSQPPAERAYPGIEVFLETEDRGAITSRFAATKDALSGLPKLKAEHGKRALVAIEQTEELLNQLFDVKEQLSAQGQKKGRR
ncbi:MAG: hypothetical protein JST54_33515 [Deltaproteobacteria bacterium]|nr:hypothetical protein [Deltaproteobacteria bacterium]